MGRQVKPVRGPYLAPVGLWASSNPQGGDAVCSDEGESEDVEAV